jgi:murein DD-endopeptidase MepM/ murein hydrolase activator NlpD
MASHTEHLNLHRALPSEATTPEVARALQAANLHRSLPPDVATPEVARALQASPWLRAVAETAHNDIAAGANAVLSALSGRRGPELRRGVQAVTGGHGQALQRLANISTGAKSNLWKDGPKPPLRALQGVFSSVHPNPPVRPFSQSTASSRHLRYGEVVPDYRLSYSEGWPIPNRYNGGYLKANSGFLRTSWFGNLRYPRDRVFHGALDLGHTASTTGAPVVATHRGRVAFVGPANSKGLGYAVVIAFNVHGVEYYTMYFHLLEDPSEHNGLRFNQEVEPGTLIGRIGGTGSTLSNDDYRNQHHLHYEFGYVNPQSQTRGVERFFESYNSELDNRDGIGNVTRIDLVETLDGGSSPSHTECLANSRKSVAGGEIHPTGNQVVAEDLIRIRKVNSISGLTIPPHFTYANRLQ